MMKKYYCRSFAVDFKPPASKLLFREDVQEKHNQKGVTTCAQNDELPLLYRSVQFWWELVKHLKIYFGNSTNCFIMASVPSLSTKDYEVGDLICSEMPLVATLLSKFKSKFCDGCLCPKSDTVTLKKCSACKHSYYCSTDCQKADWNAGHKYECQIYKRHYLTIEDNGTHLLLRTYLLLENKEELASRKVSLHDESAAKSYRDLDDVNVGMSYSHSLTIELFETCNIFSTFGIENLNYDKLFEYFCKHNRNICHVSYKNQMVAYGIFTSPSVFGHSCTPNATQSSNGYRADIRAIKKIKKGEPITICLANIVGSRKERQSFLKDLYNIDCKCERCTGSFDNEFDYEHMESLVSAMITSLAFQAGSPLILLYEHLGGYDITVSWHLMRMVEFYRKIPAKAKAHDDSIVDILETTVRHLKVTHGIDHPHYKEYSGLLEEFRKKFYGSGRKSSNAGGDF